MHASNAFALNFTTALTAIVGGIAGYYLSPYLGESMIYILPFAAGGFISIAASNLAPQLHEEVNQEKSLASIVFFLQGFVFVLFANHYFSHSGGSS